MTYTFNGVAYPFDDIEAVKETHLSLVLIGQRYVYKFKKPVRFAFVDYSTLSKRVEASRQEVILNRRTTTAMYRGLAYFIKHGQSFRWADSSYIDGGRPSSSFDEVAVVMRRIDEQHTISALLSSADSSGPNFESTLQELTGRLARFHRDNALHGGDQDAYVQSVAQYMRENIFELRGSLETQAASEATRLALENAAESTEQFIASKGRLLSERYRAGRVADGHGDLRLDHICFESLPDGSRAIQIFDCVEFNRALRVNDGASEIGFLSMNLEFQFRADLARIVEKSYAAECQDSGLDAVLPAFKLYRALVRAKVHALRLGQLHDESGEHASEMQKVADYIALASRYALFLPTPLVLIVCGLMGSGKSTLARYLKNLIHAVHLNSDVVRKTIIAKQAEAQSRRAGFGEGLYSEENTKRTYAAMNDMAHLRLMQGNPVILDATFLSTSTREAAYAMAHKAGAKVCLIECVAPQAEVLERLRNRYEEGKDISDARPELYQAQAAKWQPICEEEGVNWHRIDTSVCQGKKLAEQLSTLLKHSGNGSLLD